MYAKVLLSLLITALVPLLLVTLLTYQTSKRTLKSMADNTLEASAQTLARSAVTLLESAAKEMESWTSLDTLQDVFTGEDIDLRMGLLLRELQTKSDFLEIWCVDTNGRIAAASNFSRVGQSAGADEALQSALSGAPFMSNVTSDDAQDGIAGTYVCMAYPLHGAFDDETLIGAIVGFYDWHQIDARVSFQERIAPQEGIHLFLLDASHRIVGQGDADESVVTLLESELPGLNADGQSSVHAVTGAALDGSRHMFALATLVGPHPNATYTGVAVAPERTVLYPVRRLAWFTGLVCVAAVAGTFFLALFLSRKLSQPITMLSHTAREIAAGNLDIMPPVSVGGEMGQLAADLDVMRKSLKTQIGTLDLSVRERTHQLEDTVRQLQAEIQMREEAQRETSVREGQLRQADRMVSLGILVSGVAHEINNPNGLIALNLGLLSETWKKALPVLSAHYEEHGDFSMGALNYSELCHQMPIILADAVASSERIRAIVDDLKGFSRTSEERLDEVVDVNSVVQAAMNLASNHLRKATSDLTMDLAPDLPPIRGNQRRVEQVVINLLLNACDSLKSSDASIRIRTHRDGQWVSIEVADTGMGIAAEDLPHIADPFFTTRRNEGGTGLGLSISTGIVQEHGGALHFDSEPGVGTTACIRLPIPPSGDNA